MTRSHRLAEELEHFVPADAVEAAHRHRMLDLLAAPIDPFSRSHFTPGHFTASAFVLCPRRESLLLILHAKLHRWLQPGGHIDAADVDPIAAARRELLEEAGVKDVVVIPRDPEGGRLFDVDIHPIPANDRKGEPAHEHFDLRFLFIARSGAVQAASDARDARWVRLEDVTEELTDASVMRAVAKIRHSSFVPIAPEV